MNSSKSLSHLKYASHAAETHASRIPSGVFGHAFRVQNDLVQAKPLQSGFLADTSSGMRAVKLENSAQGTLISHGSTKQALSQMKCGAQDHMKKAFFHHAAMSKFHPTDLLPHSNPFIGPYTRLSLCLGLRGMCAWQTVANKACFYSTKCMFSANSGFPCKDTIEFANQIKRMSLISLPYTLPLRAFCTDSPIPKRFSSLMKQPVVGLTKMARHYKQAVRLQFEAFWRRNMLILVGAAGVLSCYFLWRIMYGVANVFVSLSERMAKFGLLAMAASTVAFTAIILRNRYTINPDKVYRIVMRTLNTSSKALEALGAPLTGSNLRAYVMSGGSLKLKNFKPTFSRKRCFLMFPVQGSERKGLVSAEVKKKKGKHDFKLIAIDVAPVAPLSEQRVFLVGDETEYKVGGGLMAQLRTPILKAIAAQKEFEAQDEKEAEEEERAEALREQELKEEAQKDDGV